MHLRSILSKLTTSPTITAAAQALYDEQGIRCLDHPTDHVTPWGECASCTKHCVALARADRNSLLCDGVEGAQ